MPKYILGKKRLCSSRTKKVRDIPDLVRDDVEPNEPTEAEVTAHQMVAVASLQVGLETNEATEEEIEAFFLAQEAEVSRVSTEQPVETVPIVVDDEFRFHISPKVRAELIASEWLERMPPQPKYELVDEPDHPDAWPISREECYKALTREGLTILTIDEMERRERSCLL